MLAAGLLAMCGPLWAAQKVDLDYHVHLLPLSDQAEVRLTLARGAAVRSLDFDLVFLDPPFNQNLLPTVCTLLEERQWLAEDAWVYTESETAPSTLGLPGNWRLHREQKSGRVYYALWQRLAKDID